METSPLRSAAKRYEADGHHEQAFQALWDALSLAPTPSSASELVQKGNQIALQCAHGKDFDAARRVLDKAVRGCDMVTGSAAVPLRALTVGNIGFVQFKQNQTEAALRSLRAAAAMEEEASGHATPSTLVNMCHVLNAVGKHAEAVAHAREAIGLLGDSNSPHRVSAHHVLASSLEAHGTKSSMAHAADAYRAALDLARSILDANHPMLDALDASWKAFVAKVHHVGPEYAHDTLPAVVRGLTSQASSVYSGQSGVPHWTGPYGHKHLYRDKVVSPQPLNQFAARMQASAIKKQDREERERIAISNAKRLYEKEKIKRASREAEEEVFREKEAKRIMYEEMVEALRIKEALGYMHAALRIQILYRGYLVRDLLFKWVKNATKCQAVFRSYRCRRNRRLENEFRALEASNAAKANRVTVNLVRIQAWWRKQMCVSYMVSLKKGKAVRRIHSVFLIQRVFKLFRKRRLEEVVREQNRQHEVMDAHHKNIHRAALRIQTNYRGHVARNILKFKRQRQRIEYTAAGVMQRNIRGFLLRRHIQKDRPKMLICNAQRKVQGHSAVKIQKHIRGFLARRGYERMWLQKVKRNNGEEIRKATLRIQCSWRCHVARNVLIERQLIQHKRGLRVTVVHTLLRSRVSSVMVSNRRERQKWIWAARKIQSFWLAQLRRRREAEVARYHASAHAKEKRALKRTAAAMCLQSWARGNSGRKKAAVVKKAHMERVAKVVKVQSRWRMHAASKVLRLLRRIEKYILLDEATVKKMRSAAIVIQCLYRCWVAKRAIATCRSRQYSSEKIQNSFRMFRAKKRLEDLKAVRTLKVRVAAAMRVQKSVRLFIRRLRINRLRRYYLIRRGEKALLQLKQESAITVQAVWRGHRARTVVTAEQAVLLAHTSDAMKVQAAFRSYRFRVRFAANMEMRQAARNKRIAAALKIQSSWRMVVTIVFVAKLKREVAKKTAAVVRIQTTQRKCAAKDEYSRRKAEREAGERQKILHGERWLVALACYQRFAVAAHSRLTVVHGHRALSQHVTDTLQKRYHARRHNGAAKIQALYHGFVERIYVRGLRREIAEAKRKALLLERRRTLAAMAIQRMFRVYRAKCRSNSIRKSNADAAEARRAHEDRTADPADLVAGLFLSMEAQTKTRVISEQRFRHHRNHAAAVNIQRVVKGSHARSSTQRLLLESKRQDAAIVIQIFYKAHDQARLALRMTERHKAAAKIQALYRRFLVGRELCARISQRYADQTERVGVEESRDRAATRIANAWRCVIAQRSSRSRRQARETRRQQTRKEESILIVQTGFRKSEKRHSGAHEHRGQSK